MKWTYSMIAPSSPHERAARIACLIIPRFSIDVCLHRHRSLRDKPIAVAQGEQRREIVCASADAVGVRGGMTPKQARAACPNLAVIARDFAAERAAGEELLDALETCSPDVEGAAPGLYFFDASGLPAGEAAALGAAVALAGALGYTGAAAASADGKFAARCAALVAGAGISVVPPGGNAAFLAALPVSLLPLAPGDDERFDLLGLRTLGSIAALPTAPLAARFGERARAYARLARGDDRELLRPRRVQAPYEERIAFDGVVDRLEALFFALRGCIAAVATRLAGAAQVCDRVDIVLELDTSSSAPSGAGIAECASGAATAVIAVALAEPTASAATMFDLARIALEARIGQGAVTAVMARVLPCADPPPQMTLFDGASGSRRAALAATLARLQAALDRNAIVTMAPTPARSRLPERMQRAEPVTSPREFDRAASDVRSRPAASEKPAAWAPALRLVDPPKRIEPPAAGAACAGPFRLSECWWERPVERDYYQLASVSDGLLLVFHDLRDGQWYVQGIFD
jgi:protein ImuB